MVAAPLSTRRRAIYAALALLSLFSVALIVTRYYYSREPFFGGLIWNLFLAWIPFVLSIVLYDRHRAGARPLSLVPLAALWLLFLPNAPYIVTDFKHLVASPVVPLWVDVVVLAAPAWTGMLLGFLSLYLVQAVVRQLAGPRVAWLAAVAVLGLSSFGIYLGRVLRWNSWDVIANPSILSDLGSIVVERRAIAMTVLLSGFLTRQLPRRLRVHALRSGRGALSRPCLRSPTGSRRTSAHGRRTIRTRFARSSPRTRCTSRRRFARPGAGGRRSSTAGSTVKDEPGGWTFEWQPLLETPELAIVTGTTSYRDPPQAYSNLWVLRLAEDGRCLEFTEWWMAHTEE